MRTPFAVSASTDLMDSAHEIEVEAVVRFDAPKNTAQPPMTTRWPRKPETMTASLGAAVMMLNMAMCVRVRSVRS